MPVVGFLTLTFVFLKYTSSLQVQLANVLIDCKSFTCAFMDLWFLFTTIIWDLDDTSCVGERIYKSTICTFDTIYIVSYDSHCKSHRLSFWVSSLKCKNYKRSKPGFCSSFNDHIVPRPPPPPLPTPLPTSWLLRMKGQCMSTFSNIIITHAFYVSMPCHIALKYRSPINIVFSWRCISF